MKNAVILILSLAVAVGIVVGLHHFASPQNTTPSNFVEWLEGGAFATIIAGFLLGEVLKLYKAIKGQPYERLGFREVSLLIVAFFGSAFLYVYVLKFGNLA